jgi:hypothetical protein
MKRAVGTLSVEGLGFVGFEVFEPTDGRPRFVVPESIRDKYTGRFRRTVAFAPEFSAVLLEAVEARLAAADQDA